MTFEMCQLCGAGAGYGHTDSCQNNPDRGPKETTGKTNWSVFPFREAEQVVKVFEYGAKKYGTPFTYRKGIPKPELIAAAIRHLVSIQEGEDIDTESGQLHASHVAATALMLISQYR